MSAADRLPFTAPDMMRLRAETRYMREYSRRLRGRAEDVRSRTISLHARISVGLDSQKSTGGGDRVLFQLASSDATTSTERTDRSRGGAFANPSPADHANRLAEAVQRLLRAQSPRSGALAVGLPLDRYPRRRRAASRASVIRGRQ